MEKNMPSHLASTDQRNNIAYLQRECGGWRSGVRGRPGGGRPSRPDGRGTAKPAGRAEAGEKAWSRGAAHGTTRATETSEGSRERRRRAAVRVVEFALFFFFLFSYWIVCGSI